MRKRGHVKQSFNELNVYFLCSFSVGILTWMVDRALTAYALGVSLGLTWVVRLCLWL
ncbi:hypothetical protein BDZ97DRAFT_1434450 [Flammula alnicola]|nr:hypothetical protein BDZ97DRAFT_1434450 [Flammula alnicola]